MKLRLWSVLIAILAIPLARGAFAESDLDHYFALRRQHQVASVNLSQIKVDPSYYKGTVIELRGILTGVARGGDVTSYIIECGDGCYIVTSNEEYNVSSGSKVCILAQVGDNCTASLSDLYMMAMAYQSGVIAREQWAMEAEAAKKARQAEAARQAKQAIEQKPAQKRFNRTDNLTGGSGKTLEANAVVAAYKKAIKSYNRKLSDSEADTIARSILGFSIKYQVDPRLVVAVIIAESNFRPEATSPKGAMGLGQLMPGTAAGLGVSNAYDVVENVGGSVRLIRGHLDKLSGKAPWTELTWNDLSLALASYNAGPSAVRKYGGVPPYRETRNYINKVISVYKRLCGVE